MDWKVILLQAAFAAIMAAGGGSLGFAGGERVGAHRVETERLPTELSIYLPGELEECKRAEGLRSDP